MINDDQCNNWKLTNNNFSKLFNCVTSFFYDFMLTVWSCAKLISPAVTVLTRSIGRLLCILLTDVINVKWRVSSCSFNNDSMIVNLTRLCSSPCNYIQCTRIAVMIQTCSDYGLKGKFDCCNLLIRFSFKYSVKPWTLSALIQYHMPTCDIWRFLYIFSDMRLKTCPVRYLK